MNPHLEETLAGLGPDVEDRETLRVTVSDLAEGMILVQDVVCNQGTELICKGSRLSWATNVKLKNFEATKAKLPPVVVDQSSFEAISDLALA